MRLGRLTADNSDLTSRTPHQRSTSAGRYSWLACAVGMKMLTSMIRTTRPIPTAQFVAG
jgi:hypothetical protein